MDMDRTARLFLCARCRDQVLLCSHCDRGQQYCSRACSRVSRLERRQETAQRYQSSRCGQLRHAARTARWRERRRSLRHPINKVTHQGCSVAHADAPLPTCDIPSIGEFTIGVDSTTNTGLVNAGTVPFAALVCRRCAHRLLPHVRLGWLRPSSVRRRRAHDHPN
jgi:hypothetical protein